MFWLWCLITCDDFVFGQLIILALCTFYIFKLQMLLDQYNEILLPLKLKVLDSTVSGLPYGDHQLKHASIIDLLNVDWSNQAT